MTKGFEPKSVITEYGGFVVGQSVKIKCMAIGKDHIGKINKIRNCSDLRGLAFVVDVKSKESPEGNGEWWPIELAELEKS